ncbi:hypothetical protein [Streptomyces sp. R44]|uniref:Uncharacterized protein n=1 Tax=Streptomyces sp. R44 TaxID=3238633 RepID=A0AB39T6P3_9ACTN
MKLRTTPTTIHTADGSSVTIRRRGIEYDLETRNAVGETIATVEMSADDFHALCAEMDELRYEEAA